MSNFYRAFEDKHRGSRELITARLAIYLDFLRPLRQTTAPLTALDLGCGRGEWLELLKTQEIEARGVDLDEGMLAACRERGLSVVTGDALDFLKAQPDASVAVVSAFHLIEHLPFEDAQLLIAQALRVLVPGGLLIMETPNPENVVVGTSSFYLDPSHMKPVPPNLLRFATEHAGFVRSALVRLQESQQARDGVVRSVFDVLDGVSPDYAVVGQKNADPGILQPFDDAFAHRYGVDLEQLSAYYEHHQDAQRAVLHTGLANVDQRLSEEQRATASQLARVHEVIGSLDERSHAIATSVESLAHKSNAAGANVAELDRRSEGIAHALESLKRRSEAETANIARQILDVNNNVALLEARIASVLAESSRNVAELSTVLSRSHLDGEERRREQDSIARAKIEELQRQLRAQEEKHALAISDLAVARRRAAHAEALAAEAERVRAATASWAQGMEQTLLAMQQSYTWRSSKMVRAIGHRSGIARLLGRCERFAKRKARGLLVKASTSERVRRIIHPWRRRFPALNRFAMRLAARLRGDVVIVPPPSLLEDALLNLPRSGRALYDELSRSIPHS